jgi:uncharacterized protein
MKILFYLGHPAHYHLFKNPIKKIGPENAVVLIKTKDVLEKLLIEDKIPYINVDSGSSRNQAGKTFRIARKFFRRIYKIYNVIRKEKPALLAGSAAEIAVLGKIFRKPSYVFFEDDFEKVKPFGRITGPLATHLICPNVCSAWKWNYKKIGYDSYHELAYLHPDHFTPDREVVEKIFLQGTKNFIIRFVELGAYHDVGKKGITDELAMQLIKKLEPHGKVYVTSEREISPQFEPYRIAIRASDIHHAMHFADMFISDSQTMTAEAAVLGTPALRFNDFVRELSYLEELEFKYALTYGFRTDDFNSLLNKLDELLAMRDIKEVWKVRRNKMLYEKINLADWISEFLQTGKPVVKYKTELK